MILKPASSLHSNPPQTVLFDWGGVIIDHPIDGIHRFVSEHLPEITPAVFVGPAMLAFQRGELDESAFWKCAGARSSVALDAFGGSLWRTAFEHSYVERPAVLRLAGHLQRAGIRTGVLSNTEKPSVGMLMERGYPCFDAYYLSCEWGMVKPEREIYERCLKVLAADPATVLFIDDKPENVAAARQLGMRGHVMEDLPGLTACLVDNGLPVPA
jgi:FMN phosphatase YigB (HAD superfamily)